MAIKTTYTVKSGDRISYIASWYNVTSQEIINATPSVFTPARNIKTNELIISGAIGPGEALLYPGDVLNIPEGIIDQAISDQLVKASSEEEINIIINGKNCPLPHDFNLTEYFDACSNSSTLTYPNDTNIKSPLFKIDISTFKEKGLPAIKIYIGNDNLINGFIEIPAFEVTKESSTQTLGIRNKTAILEKSDFFPNIQKEFIDMNVKEIAETICNFYSVEVQVMDGIDIGENFPKASRGDDENPYSFISKLAKERSILVSNTGDGKLYFLKSSIGNPVANFNIDSEFIDFLGVESLEFVFDTTKIFGNYLGKTQTTDEDNLTESVKSTILNQQSIKIISYTDVSAVDLKKVTAWEEQKSIREFYKNSIPYPSFINPKNGKRWKAGETITIQASEANIKNPVELLIQSVEFSSDSSDKRTATLNLIPADVYA